MTPKSLPPLPPPPPPYCSITKQTLTELNTSSTCYYYVPGYIDTNIPIMQYQNDVDMWISIYLTLSLENGTVIPNFFESCKPAITLALCRSYFTDCHDTTLANCIRSCHTLNDCLLEMMKKSKINPDDLIRGMDDCVAYEQCSDTVDYFCCYQPVLGETKADGYLSYNLLLVFFIFLLILILKKSITLCQDKNLESKDK